MRQLSSVEVSVGRGLRAVMTNGVRHVTAEEDPAGNGPSESGWIPINWRALASAVQ
jgi:hypothetical protein